MKLGIKSNFGSVDFKRKRVCFRACHKYDIRMLQLYKRSHTKEIIPQIFHENCEILDDVLHVHVHGINDAISYFDSIFNNYKDVFMTHVSYSHEDDTVNAAWVRVKHDETIIYGLDRLILKDYKFQYIFSKEIKLEKI